MNTKPKFFIKSLKNGKGTNTDFDWTPFLPTLKKDGTWKPGLWTPKVEDIEICQSGWYCTTEEFFQEWKGTEYYLAEVKGKVVYGDTKLVAQQMRLISVVTNEIWGEVIRSVGGSLDLSGTQITQLPDGLKRKVIRESD